MKKRSLWPMQGLLFILFILSGTFVSAQIQFQNGAYEELLKKCRKEKKLLLVDAYTDWCGWCKVMDQKTFSDSAVGKTASAYFIAVKYEMEKSEDGKMLAAKFNVRQYPTVLIINHEGKLIYTIEGFSPAAVFLEELQRAAKLKD
jgi:thiol:disulfide interchange protein